jgi:hypothetical protein
MFVVARVDGEERLVERMFRAGVRNNSRRRNPQ